MKKIIILLKLIFTSALLLNTSACQVFKKDNYPKVTTIEVVPIPVTTIEAKPIAFTTLEVVNPSVTNTTKIEGKNPPVTTKIEGENPPVTTKVDNPPVTTKIEVDNPPVTKVDNPPILTQQEEKKQKTQIVIIEKTLKELKAEKTIEGIKINLPDNILFEFDKYNIRAQAKPSLAKINQVLTHYKDAKVFINGHTDSKGDDDYNQQLSEKRAAAVKYYFINVFKVAEPSIQTKGFGKSKPIAANNNPDGSDNHTGREKNRRVEFIIKTETRKIVKKADTDTFSEAVNAAMNASLLAQKAKTGAEWQQVANKWQEAIDLMKAVPQSNSNYEKAQKKVGEYQNNWNYANKNI